jgi:signal transduction histidine kinase
VLRNLVNNAIVHTPPHGIILVSATIDHRPPTTDREHDSSVVRRPPSVVVSVCDDGPGIAPEHLPNIFERFYRADRSRARATGGAGLGLAIVKQLVEAQAGRVWAESTPGQGARFSFTLPLAQGELHHPLTRT